MKRRGRPKNPDVLTPREWEVLDLLREGLSNQEVADRLGVSLAGAKFHVSEIITKFGVSSREEAARWRPERRPVLGLSSLMLWRDLPFTLSLAPNLLAGALVLPLAIGVIVVAALATNGTLSPSRFLTSGPSAEPTPGFAGCQPPQCVAVKPQRFTTLQEAAALASFEPKLPAVIPSGFRPYSVELLRFPTNPPGRTDVHNDTVTVYYRDGSGHNLAVSQGFPAASSGFDVNARQGTHGTVDIAGRDYTWLRGHWVNGSRFPVVPEPPQSTFPNGTSIPYLGPPATLLYWEIGRFGPGWNVSPDRESIQYSSPMSYSIMSDSLSVEELVEIARSVSFD